MSTNENCQVGCPAILEVATQQAANTAALTALDRRETARQETDTAWGEVIAGASQEERLTVEYDSDSNEPLGSLMTRRDTSEMFARIARRGDAESRTAIESDQWLLDRKTEARQAACTDGPGKRFICVGAAVCRSRVQDDGLPNRA